RALLPCNEPGTLQPRQVAAGGRRGDAEQRRQCRRGERSAFCDELQRLGLLRSDVTGTRALTRDAAETTCNGEEGAREPVLVGHERKTCTLQESASRQASKLGRPRKCLTCRLFQSH